MIKDWDVNLLGVEATHKSGLRIKRQPDKYNEKPEWVVVFQPHSDETDNPLISEGIACFNHVNAIKMLGFYLKKHSLQLEDIVLITNEYAKVKYNRCIDTEQLRSYLDGREFFPVDVISLIRAAIYFYGKK
ncbi:MAG: hypothetical protein HZT40_01560 [Candidatus Thiothrix singaporensis]|uniref:Uncharacterized protein n=1 Tax=Candidatus Thiothrix singaporensis TaxID=2799669 RepID=A0A7L6AN38_9GAMM|nr:MAG: hypothetical protein HZT40_01560 [Candidatus Thiothrix singaporensis]